MSLRHENITEQIIGCFFDVYNELGHGFLESVYANALAIRFAERGLAFEREVPLTVSYHGSVVGDFRADFLVEKVVVVELKAAGKLEKAHEAQLINYLRATGIEVGLLMNFGPKAEFRRMVF